MKKLYVGNLPYSASEEDVRELFAPHGEIYSVKVITDRETGRSRGFGFVEMADEAAQAAIDSLHDTDYGGRALTVNEARERPRRD